MVTTRDRRAYMRAYMRKRRAGTQQTEAGKLRAALVEVRDDLADSKTDKGKRLHRLAVEALGGGDA